MLIYELENLRIGWININSFDQNLDDFMMPFQSYKWMDSVGTVLLICGDLTVQSKPLVRFSGFHEDKAIILPENPGQIGYFLVANESILAFL